MSDEQWDASRLQTIGLRMAGDAIAERGPRGERIVDDTFLLVLNAGAQEHDFHLPNGTDAPWRMVLDTARPDAPVDGEAPRTYRLAGRSTVVLRLPRA